MRRAHKKMVIDALPMVIETLDANNSAVYKRNELILLLKKNYSNWNIDPMINVFDFISLLLRKTDLSKAVLEFPTRNETRYLWKKPSIFEVSLSLRKNAYLSHHSAIYLHNLTNSQPINVYINYEQPKHNISGELSQSAIDTAFNKPVRITKNKANYSDKKIWIINGMHTQAYGVFGKADSWLRNLRITNVERTLVDIAVRPIYSGGIFEVLKAYRNAKEEVSIDKVVETLRAINYVYPYHQAIGFYFQIAGYDISALEVLKGFEFNFDFYLTHQMTKMVYSKEWRIYYPAELQ